MKKINEKNIVDIFAGIFLAIFIMPQLRQSLLNAFCSPEMQELSSNSCPAAFVIFVIVPILLGVWIFYRFLDKIGVIERLEEMV